MSARPPRPPARHHVQIIADAGGPAALAQALAPRVGAPLRRLRERAKAWKRAGSIPGDYWAVLAELKVAPLAELAGHAARRLRGERGVEPAASLPPAGQTTTLLPDSHEHGNGDRA